MIVQFFNDYKGPQFKIPKLIPVGSVIQCADSTGAKKLKVIGFKGHQSTRKRRLTGGVGSIAIVTVVKGLNSLKKKVHYALIVRQKYQYTRFKGLNSGKVRFVDNAAILLQKDLSLKKSTIKGPVARQVSFKKKYSEINAVYR